MSTKDRGPAPKSDPVADFKAQLRSSFRWRGDRTDDMYLADVTGWWANALLLEQMGEMLSNLFPDIRPTVVLGPASRGALVGALVARHLGCGLVELRKNPGPDADSDQWLITRTPPDYRNRNLRVGFQRQHISSGDRVLLTDDWIATGGQATAAHELITRAGASWVGAAVLVDGLTDSRLRHDLDVRSLVHIRDLG